MKLNMMDTLDKMDKLIIMGNRKIDQSGMLDNVHKMGQIGKVGLFEEN